MQRPQPQPQPQQRGAGATTARGVEINSVRDLLPFLRGAPVTYRFEKHKVSGHPTQPNQALLEPTHALALALPSAALLRFLVGF